MLALQLNIMIWINMYIIVSLLSLCLQPSSQQYIMVELEQIRSEICRNEIVIQPTKNFILLEYQNYGKLSQVILIGWLYTK